MNAAPAILSRLNELILAVDPAADGQLHLIPFGGGVQLTGVLTSAVISKGKLTDLLADAAAESGTHVDANPVVVKKPQLSTTTALAGGQVPDRAPNFDNMDPQLPDRIGIIYQGMMPLDSITPTGKYKRIHLKVSDKLRPELNFVGMVAPIILAKDFTIIDGELRYEILKNQVGSTQTVPVIVLDAVGDRADFVRLVLNRSAEFQRWVYPEVDEFLDRLPQIAPALEPLGFFGNNILPTSFFSGTVLEYRIINEHEQQKAYSQELGLAAWAEERRAQVAAAEAKNSAKRKKVVKPSAKTSVSLFDMNFDDLEDELVLTTDPEARKKESEGRMKELAAVITEKFDADVIAKKGGIKQNSRRSTKKKTADALAAAEAEAAVDAEVEAPVTEGGEDD